MLLHEEVQKSIKEEDKMHQCVKCGMMYEEASNELLKGCNKCGGKFFFFVRKDTLEKVKQLTVDLTPKDRKEIVRDIKELIDYEDLDKPVILDIESIRILKPGQYELDLVDLFRGKPLVYKLGEGKYVIDLASTFEAKEKD
ncbi:MAG: Zn-ribbon containing protein [Nanoarchaeota archaeon]